MSKKTITQYSIYVVQQFVYIHGVVEKKEQEKTDAKTSLMGSPLFYSFLWSGIVGCWLKNCKLPWGYLAYKKLAALTCLTHLV